MYDTVSVYSYLEEWIPVNVVLVSTAATRHLRLSENIPQDQCVFLHWYEDQILAPGCDV